MIESILAWFKPDSPVYGVLSVSASVCTLVALWFTVKAVNDSKKQNIKTSAKNSIDTIFENLERRLDHLTFHGFTSGTPETHFGRIAIVRTNVTNHANHFNRKANFSVLEEYISYLNGCLPLLDDLLIDLEDSKLSKFYKDQMVFELKFANDEIKDVLKKCLHLEKTNSGGNSTRIEAMISKIDEIQARAH